MASFLSITYCGLSLSTMRAMNCWQPKEHGGFDVVSDRGACTPTLELSLGKHPAGQMQVTPSNEDVGKSIPHSSRMNLWQHVVQHKQC
jgi:hypothetical protein